MTNKKSKKLICKNLFFLFCALSFSSKVFAMENENMLMKKLKFIQKQSQIIDDFYMHTYSNRKEELNAFVKLEKEQWRQENIFKKGLSFIFGRDTKINREINKSKKNNLKTKDLLLDSFETHAEKLGINLSPFSKIQEPVYCGLSIDGGGMRGLIPALWIQRIEENTGKRITDLIDDFGGTSAGGIISLGLVAGSKNRIEDVVKLFKENGQDIFPKDSNLIKKKIYDIQGWIWDARYSVEPLKKVLSGFFQDLNLSDALNPVLTTAVNINPYKSSTVHTFESRKALLQEQDNVPMTYAALATSVAPTYFEAVGDWVDGGLWKNNPTQLVYNRIIDHYNCDRKKIVMISLGTGESPRNSLKILPKNTGKLRATPAIIDMFMRTSSDGVEYEMQNSLGSQHYHRIQTRFERNIEMDDTSLEAIEDLEFAAETQFRKLKPISKFLLDNFDRKKEGAF